MVVVAFEVLSCGWWTRIVRNVVKLDCNLCSLRRIVISVLSDAFLRYLYMCDGWLGLMVWIGIQLIGYGCIIAECCFALLGIRSTCTSRFSWLIVLEFQVPIRSHRNWTWPLRIRWKHSYQFVRMYTFSLLLARSWLHLLAGHSFPQLLLFLNNT